MFIRGIFRKNFKFLFNTINSLVNISRFKGHLNFVVVLLNTTLNLIIYNKIKLKYSEVVVVIFYPNILIIVYKVSPFKLYYDPNKSSIFLDTNNINYIHLSKIFH